MEPDFSRDLTTEAVRESFVAPWDRPERGAQAIRPRMIPAAGGLKPSRAVDSAEALP